MGCLTDAYTTRSAKMTSVPLPDPPPGVAELINAGRDREAAEQGATGRLSTRNGGHMDPITQLDQLGPHLGAVVAGITPDQLDNPTPCAEFAVRGVLDAGRAQDVDQPHGRPPSG